jgi:hypothetical protein
MLSPEFAQAHSQLSIALGKMKNKHGAIQKAATAARLNHRNESYSANLGQLYFGARIYAEAKLGFQQPTSSDSEKISSLANKWLGGDQRPGRVSEGICSEGTAIRVPAVGPTALSGHEE